MKNENIICWWNDHTKEKSYTITNKTTDEWEKENPDKIIQFVFNKKSDMYSEEETDRLSYLRHCSMYELKPEYLDMIFIENKEGRPWRIIGLHPRNTKYKFICEYIDTNEKFRATPGWVKTNIANDILRTKYTEGE